MRLQNADHSRGGAEGVEAAVVGGEGLSALAPASLVGQGGTAV
jgi:hypothetical protein